jgi:hypothetical protein
VELSISPNHFNQFTCLALTLELAQYLLMLIRLEAIAATPRGRITTAPGPSCISRLARRRDLRTHVLCLWSLTMPDACVSPPVARQRQTRSSQRRFLVRPQLLTRVSSLPAGRSFRLSDLSTLDPSHPDRSFATVSRSRTRRVGPYPWRPLHRPGVPSTHRSPG